MLFRIGMLYTYLAWTSGVARSTKKGNARASMCGTSSEYRLPRFFYRGISRYNYFSLLGSRRKLGSIVSRDKESDMKLRQKYARHYLCFIF